MSPLASRLPVLPRTAMSSGVTITDPFASCDSTSIPARVRTVQPCGRPSTIRVPMVTASRPNRALAKFSTVSFISASDTRPRICTAPSGDRVPLNVGGPSGCGSGTSGRTASSANTSGSAFARSPTTRSNAACSVPCSATSATSASE